MSNVSPLPFIKQQRRSTFDIVKEMIETSKAIPAKPRLNRPEHLGCETFEVWLCNGAIREVIDNINIILADIGNATVRQVYYQFVTRGWLNNNQREYNRLKKIISRSRNAGLIPWDAIVDRTRKRKGEIDYSPPIALPDYPRRVKTCQINGLVGDRRLSGAHLPPPG